MSRPLEPAHISGRSLPRTPLSFVLSFLFLFLLAISTPAQPAATATVLELGKPITRELAGGETNSFQITLAAGQFGLVEVDQRRINVAMSLFTADGKKLIEADAIRAGEPEAVSVVAETSMTYRVEVRATEPGAPRTPYEIKLKEVRAATEEDRIAEKASALTVEAMRLDAADTADARRQAIDKYQQAIPLWHSAKNLVWEAAMLYLISNAYVNQGEKQKAFDFAGQAVTVAQAAVKQAADEKQRRNALGVEANAYSMLGRVNREFGDMKKALEYLDQALKIKEQIDDQVGKATTLNDMAIAYQLMGDYQKSLDYLNLARPIIHEVGDRGKEGSLLNNICVLNNALGHYRKALEFCNQALSINLELKDPMRESISLNSMGNAYSSLGEYQKALDCYTRYYAVSKSRGNLDSQAIALNNLGWLYATLGDQKKAIGFYNQALEIFHAQGNQYREANVLSNIAVNYAEMKDFKQALEINLRVLPLRRSTNNGEGEAITLNNIASCYQSLGDRQQAENYYHQAIAAHRKIGDPRQLATALKNIGTLYRDKGDAQKALEYFNEGLQISRQIGDPDNEAGALSLIAEIERNRGNLAEARSRIEAAIAAAESLRTNIKSYQLRSSFFATVRNYHEFYVDLLMRLHKQNPAGGFDAEAFQASEKGRARSLLEMLNEAGTEIQQGVDPALVERERILRRNISGKADDQIRMLGGKHTEDQVTAAAKEIEALTTEYEQVESEIRQKSPRYAALTQPLPIKLTEIQSNLLDEDTVLVEYALGETKSFVWIVTPASIRSFELSKRTEIEAAARRVYDLITASDRVLPSEGPEQRRKRLEQADADYPAAAAELSRMLVGPLASELGKKRLLIVSEGVLQFIPFAALPDPASPEAAPLVVTHEIVNLPSASVLGVLRREAADRQPSQKAVAVFADPVFDAQDPRLTLVRKALLTETNGAAPTGEVKRSAEESDLGDLPRLRFSRQEAQQIIRLASKDQSFEALDFAANRDAANSPELQQYRIVHFATHGLINNQHAELSGIVLSLVNEKGQPQNGFLRLYDIYNMNLKAELVVVSACKTALGKDIKGEGMVGFARAFMYAGTKRVVTSLWQTEDRATAVLMGRFYEGMLTDHLSPSAALRSAQLSMWKDKRWRQPRYWAAFTLQGEWK